MNDAPWSLEILKKKNLKRNFKNTADFTVKKSGSKKNQIHLKKYLDLFYYYM